MFGNIGIAEILLIVVLAFMLGALFTVVPFWFIFKKAGYHPALSLLMVIPLADIVMKFFLAFADWPSLKNVPGESDPRPR